MQSDHKLSSDGASNRDCTSRHNPVVCGSLFLALTSKSDFSQKRTAAVRVALSILCILIASALAGLQVLHLFGISLDVFRIVGGLIIAYMGANMLSGEQKVAQVPPSSPTETDATNSLVPLVMFAAGPGTITAVVTIASEHTPTGLPLSALVAHSSHLPRVRR